jgi:hypothetical protein
MFCKLSASCPTVQINGYPQPGDLPPDNAHNAWRIAHGPEVIIYSSHLILLERSLTISEGLSSYHNTSPRLPWRPFSRHKCMKI